MTHWQPKEPKSDFVADIQTFVRNKLKDPRIEMPNLMKLTRKELEHLSLALDNR